MVDAPCSGEGMFRKEMAAGEDWSQEITEMCAHRQGEILHSASQMLRGGGRMVYSTCTFSPEENEGAISAFLQSHPDFHLVSVSAPHFAKGRPQWADGNEELSKTLRLWPHLLRCEGHFVAVLERDADAGEGDFKSLVGEKMPKELAEFLRENEITLPKGELLSFGQNYYLAPQGTPDLKGLKVLRAGLSLGQVLKNRFEPDHALALWLKNAKRVRHLSTQEAGKYLRGETLPYEEKGWTLVQYDGLSLGWGKASGGILKNHFPKGLRALSAEKE
jgi:NOL1/NOP2/fmu family ribosome biogenesis protein